MGLGCDEEGRRVGVHNINFSDGNLWVLKGATLFYVNCWSIRLS
jgi:hypothetical protein